VREEFSAMVPSLYPAKKNSDFRSMKFDPLSLDGYGKERKKGKNEGKGEKEEAFTRYSGVSVCMQGGGKEKRKLLHEIAERRPLFLSGEKRKRGEEGGGGTHCPKRSPRWIVKASNGCVGRRGKRKKKKWGKRERFINPTTLPFDASQIKKGKRRGKKKGMVRRKGETG